MIGRRRLMSLALGGAALGLRPGGARAQATHNPSRLLRVDSSSLGQGRRGRPEVSGYVQNDYGRSAGGVQLLVELLDAAGQVTGRATGYVSGSVPAFGRAYFSVAVPPGGVDHRVTVLSFDWETGAGS